MNTLETINNQIDILRDKLETERIKFEKNFWAVYRKGGETTSNAKKRFFLNLEYPNDDLRILQKATFILLYEVSRVCEENDLTYWLDFGTLLGAVRHNGFIPWDDDIDIGMMRGDIEKLIEIVNNGNRLIKIDQFYCIDWDTCNIVRVLFKDPSIKVFVDIFIYDFCNTENLKDTWNKYRKIRKEFSDGMLCYRPVPLQDRTLNYWEQRRVVNPEYIDAIKKETKQKNNELGIVPDKTSYIIWGIDNFSYFDHKMGVEPYGTYFPLGKLKFEEQEFCVPKCAIDYVKSIYCDIYRLPNDLLSHSHVGINEVLIENCKKLISQYYS